MGDKIQDNPLETNTQVTSEPNQDPIIDVPNEPKKIVSEPTVEELRKMPVVLKLIQDARTEEKTKLYKTLEAKDVEIKKLGEEVERLKGLLMEKENENLSEVELLQKQINELNKNYEMLQVNLEAEREAAEKEKRLAKLEAYKERRLREEGDELIIALVGGNSEEEIDESIEKAKKEYQAIVEKTRSQLEIETKNSEDVKKRQKITNTPKVTNPPASSIDGLSREEIRRMSPDEWKKVREKALRAAKEGLLD